MKLSRVASVVLVAGIVLARPAMGQSDPYTFYDARGEAVVYLDVDDGLTFFLWSGEPVAYLDGEESVYGFNGDHLGWYHEGIVYNNDGRVVAAPASAFVEPVRIAPLKGLKRLKPLKGLRSLRPLRPLFRSSWASMPTRAHFLTGVR